jgi:hypothetical protein
LRSEAQLEEANTVLLWKKTVPFVKDVGYPFDSCLSDFVYCIQRDIAAFFGIGYKDTEEPVFTMPMRPAY